MVDHGLTVLAGQTMYKGLACSSTSSFSWCREQHELDSISAHRFRSALDSRTRHGCQVDIAAAPNFVQPSTRAPTHLAASLTMLLTDSSDINTGSFYSTTRCRRWFGAASPALSRYLRHDALGVQAMRAQHASQHGMYRAIDSYPR
jgi:hypothetical protein